jgi:hypothetical protein
MKDTALRHSETAWTREPLGRLTGRLKALTGRPSVRKAFAERALDRFLQFAEDLDEGVLAGVVSAPTDFEFLLRLMEKSQTSQLLGGEGPLQNARLRGLRARVEILQAEGGVWSAQDVAAHLGISRQAVDKRRKGRRLLGLPTGRHGYSYPAWQFTREGTLPGLEEVLGSLSDHDPWMSASFLMEPSARLDDKRPLDVLRRGGLAEVMRAARAFGEHGSD